jgi:hypothetical protein
MKSEYWTTALHILCDIILHAMGDLFICDTCSAKYRHFTKVVAVYGKESPFTISTHKNMLITFSSISE